MPSIKQTLDGTFDKAGLVMLYVTLSDPLSFLSGTITSIDGVSVKTILNAICAAQSLFDTLKDIPVPGHFGVNLTARAGLHAGNTHHYTRMQTCQHCGSLLVR